jgi:hypothetical protein
MQFNKTYLLLFLLLFLVEAAIAYYLKDGFIRHTFGDYLVVIMLYLFLKSFIKIKPISASVVVLLIAFAVEFLQLTSFLEYFNLDNNYYAKLILGSTFQISDLLAYTLGVLTIIAIENKRSTLSIFR